MKKSVRIFKGFIFLSCLVLLCSCASIHPTIQSYLRPGIDPRYVKKVAVLKFANHTPDKFAGERIRDLVIMEALALKKFDVVEKGVVDEVLAEEGVGPNFVLNKETIKRIGAKLKVPAVLVGSVITMEKKREGSYTYPVVAISLRLIDVATGKVIWEATGVETGYSIWGRIFGWSPENEIEVSMRLIRRLLETF